MVYGYVRVSSADQNEARQVDAMSANGIDDARIYVDRQSGKDFNRMQYRRLMRKLKKGDLLVVQSIDRLGRNYEEILEQWRVLTRDRKVDICVLDMPLLDTRNGRDLMGTFIADLVLQILSFVAQNERESIKRRQAEGIAAARARGVRFGRPPRPVPENFDEVLEQWERRDISLDMAAKLCDLPRGTFYSKARQRKDAKSIRADAS